MLGRVLDWHIPCFRHSWSVCFKYSLALPSVGHIQFVLQKFDAVLKFLGDLDYIPKLISVSTIFYDLWALLLHVYDYKCVVNITAISNLFELHKAGVFSISHEICIWANLLSYASQFIPSILCQMHLWCCTFSSQLSVMCEYIFWLSACVRMSMRDIE